MDKDDREIRRAVNKALSNLFKQIKSEPTLVELELDGHNHDQEQYKTLKQVGEWLFHRR